MTHTVTLHYLHQYVASLRSSFPLYSLQRNLNRSSSLLWQLFFRHQNLQNLWNSFLIIQKWCCRQEIKRSYRTRYFEFYRARNIKLFIYKSITYSSYNIDNLIHLHGWHNSQADPYTKLHTIYCMWYINASSTAVTKIFYEELKNEMQMK